METLIMILALLFAIAIGVILVYFFAWALIEMVNSLSDVDENPLKFWGKNKQ